MEQQNEATQDTMPDDLTEKDIRSIWQMPYGLVKTAIKDGLLVKVGMQVTGKKGRPARLFSRVSVEALARAYEATRKPQNQSG